ncbi:class I SAM-dependent methyltransferase [Rummeliibacillus suwonensis]|uniref:class I SAM-dependent methyltransferase n=1 Tax=Rummeliibacillus suwonensis TaxID=1306154 RepID=UPI00289D63B0|nr:methyltransferase domain-containing protein [Rummeliibacillus suwonensis]
METTTFNVQNVFSEKSQYWDSKNENILQIKGESERLLNLLPIYVHSSFNVLEIGSGTGKIIKKILNMEKEINLFATDLSIDMLQKIKKNTKNSKINLVVNDAHSLPFRNNTFDLIILQQVIHHLRHPERAMMEIGRVLKKGGKILLLAVGSGYQKNIFPFSNLHITEDYLGRITVTDIQNLVESAELSLITIFQDFFKFTFANFESYFRFMDSIGALNKPFGYRTDHVC